MAAVDRGALRHARRLRHRRQPARSDRRQGPRRHALRLRHARHAHPSSQHGGGRTLDAERCGGPAHLCLGQPRSSVPHHVRSTATARLDVFPAKAQGRSVLIGRTVYGESRPNPEAKQPARQGRSALRSGWCRHQRRIRLQGQPARQPAAVGRGSTRATLDWSADPATGTRGLYQQHDLSTRSTGPSSRHRAGSAASIAPPSMKPICSRRWTCNLRGAAGRHAVCHQHRLRRQRPAHADRLRQRRQDHLRVRPADLPPDPSDHHPPGRAERPRDAALQECRHGAGSALHLRSGRQHHPHPRRRTADDLLHITRWWTRSATTPTTPSTA